ncbi:MAG: autotransporter-associated beta strand repeat-containing protein, partial [Puniceicoccales bacterium]|nr:autotransporter-associated beta strand repeat-containing protein [Puniceicoccales bacterium]
MSCLALLRSRSARRALLAAASALAIAPLAGADNYIWQTPSDGTDGVWSTAPADEYWFSSGIKPWSDNNTAIFSSAEGGNVQVSGVVTPSAVQVTGVGDWTFSTGENIGLGIAGTGTFEKSGSGSLTVRNVNSFAGTVTVLEGTLALLNERALGANATIAVKADATLGIGGNWEGRGGYLTWETGASLQVGADSTQAAVFKVDRLGVSGKIAFDLSNANLAESANDRVEVSGPLDLAGAKLDLNFTGNPVNPAQERNYVLFTYGSLPMDSNLTSSLLSPSQLAERTSYRLTADPVEKVIRLTVQGTAETLTWRSTNGNTLWQTTPKDNSAPMTDNWVNRAGSADYFYTADAVIFDNTANPAGQDVTIQGRVNPVSWVVNAWPDEDSHPFNYTFNAASAGTGHGVSGETGLTKTGSGTMTILTWNDFTGKVSIQGGTVSVGDGIVANVALGGEGSISLRAGTSLIYKLAAGTYDFTRLLEGGGRFVKDGVTNVMTFGRNGAGIIYNQIDVDLDVLGGELEIIGDRTGTQLLAEDRDITIHSEGLLRTPAKSLGDNFTTKITVNGVTGSLTRGRWELSGNQFIQPGNLEVNSGRITSTAGINGVVLTLGNTGDLNVSGEASFELPVILTASTIFKATAPGTELTFVEQVEDGGSGYSFAVNGPAKVDFAKGAVFSGATVVETAGSSVNFAGSTPPSTTALQLADGAKASLSNGAFTLSSAQFESKAGHTNDDGVFTDITGSARVAGGHTLSVGGHDTVETLRLSGDLILGSDSKLHLTVESGVTNQNDTIYTQNLNVQGTHSNPVVLYFESDDGVFRNGTYSLINFTATDSFDGLNFGVQGIPVLRDSVALPMVVIDSGKVNLVIATGNTKLTWQGENSDEWNQSTTKNWMDEFIIGADRTAAFQNGDAVIFSGAAPLVRITADVRPGRITVESATNHTFTSAGGVIIGENTSLLKRGQGTLSLAGGLHTFTGTVTVLGGTLELAGGDTADNTLIGNNGVASRLGAGSGAGSLVLDGGTLSFSGGNATPDGVVTTETNRSFTIGQNGATIASNITSGTPHTNYNRVLFSEDVPVAYSGRGDRTLTLAGNSNGDPTVSTNYNEIGLRLVDPEGGKLSVVKDGAGTWGLTNASNSYTGGLTIKAGTVVINNARALGALPTTFFARNLTIDAGGTLRSTGFALTLEANRGISLTLNPNRNPNPLLDTPLNTFRTDTPLTVNGVISGQGGILKTGSGTLALAGVNTFSGGISINTGIVLVQNDQAIPYGDNRYGVWMTGAAGGALALASDAHVNWLLSSPENNTTSEVYAQGGGTKTLYVGEYATAATTSYAFTGNLNENGATL